MNSENTVPTPKMFDPSQYCAQCGLPLPRCNNLGGEEWHRLWDETVEGIADALRQVGEE